MSVNLITHRTSPRSRQALFEKTRHRILSRKATQNRSPQQLLLLLDELMKFELGVFLLDNQGINGYWIDHVVNWVPTAQKPPEMSELEYIIYSQFPSALATRERHQIFLQLIQDRIDLVQCALSVPCGLMSEFFQLNSEHIFSTHFVGLDLDERVLELTQLMAERKGMQENCEFYWGDSWEMNFDNEFDLLSSNGLNFFEHDDEKVIELYQLFFNALKTGGSLVTSFLTPPPLISSVSPWLMEYIDPDMMDLENQLFSDVIDVHWNAYRTEDQTRHQLESVGFKKIRFIYDKAHIFPTVLAEK
ncbi:MAG: hypothetical protein CENE_02801 [Candidatus Celerinatantimonas neptuna]|nr:MAG: hypothetical protein CENE_02801 [Candidatus Celerinatantimonas neptuna]